MKDFVLPLAFTVLIVVGVGGMIRAVFAVYLHRKRIRDYYAAVDLVSVGQTWRKTVQDFDIDPWTKPVSICLRVEEIRYASNGDKWCRCMTHDAGELRLTAEELVDEYEQYE